MRRRRRHLLRRGVRLLLRHARRRLEALGVEARVRGELALFGGEVGVGLGVERQLVRAQVLPQPQWSVMTWSSHGGDGVITSHLHVVEERARLHLAIGGKVIK